MNHGELIKYISENIYGLQNTQPLLAYINENINYSENKNGIFVNISMLTIDQLNDIYLLMNKTDYTPQDISKYDKDMEKEVKHNVTKSKPKPELKPIELSKLQSSLLNYSK